MARARLPTHEERKAWKDETARDIAYAPVADDGDGVEGAAVSAPEAAANKAPSRAPVLRKKTPVPDTKPPARAKRAVVLNVGDFSRLDAASAARFTKVHACRDAELDLHDMNQAEAHAALEVFMATAMREGWRNVRIITGKGRSSGGVLRSALPHWLELSAAAVRILAISHAAPREGGEGVLLVLLKRPR